MTVHLGRRGAGETRIAVEAVERGSLFAYRLFDGAHLLRETLLEEVWRSNECYSLPAGKTSRSIGFFNRLALFSSSETGRRADE